MKQKLEQPDSSVIAQRARQVVAISETDAASLQSPRVANIGNDVAHLLGEAWTAAGRADDATTVKRLPPVGAGAGIDRFEAARLAGEADRRVRAIANGVATSETEEAIVGAI